MARKTHSPKRKAAGVRLWLVLMKAYHALEKHAEASLVGCGLGQSDFSVLEVLLHKGPMPVNTIGPKVFLTAGSISVAVDRLHAKRLVSRTESTDDRRIRIVELTSKGRELISRVFAEHAAAMEAATEGLSGREKAELAELLKKVGKYAEALPKEAAPRP
jgi:MarR family 2-MHQ and catechol resistance regulon transcriptional repressor